MKIPATLHSVASFSTALAILTAAPLASAGNDADPPPAPPTTEPSPPARLTAPLPATTPAAARWPSPARPRPRWRAPARPRTSTTRPSRADGIPLAGYHNDLFYLRDADDNFRLYVQGRAQIDFYSYAGPGVSRHHAQADALPAPHSAGDHRRVLPQTGGSASPATSARPRSTIRRARTRHRGRPGRCADRDDGQIRAAHRPRVQGGADRRVLELPRRSALQRADRPVRRSVHDGESNERQIHPVHGALARRARRRHPDEQGDRRDVLGRDPDKYLFYYSAGLFNGDGQNRLNTDSAATSWRAPSCTRSRRTSRSSKDLQIGASFRYGQRDKKYIVLRLHALSTQGNYTFWSPTYSGLEGHDAHLARRAHQIGVAGELRVPISMVDLTSEVVYIDNDTREVQEGYPGDRDSERFGDMHGYLVLRRSSAFGSASATSTGLPGYENLPHVDCQQAGPSRPPHALQLLVKWEQLHLNYSARAAGRRGHEERRRRHQGQRVLARRELLGDASTSGPRSTTCSTCSRTRRRSSGRTADSPAQTRRNRALAPGNTLGKGVNDDARDNAHDVHEISRAVRDRALKGNPMGRIAIVFLGVVAAVSFIPLAACDDDTTLSPCLTTAAPPTQARHSTAPPPTQARSEPSMGPRLRRTPRATRARTAQPAANTGCQDCVNAVQTALTRCG